MKYARIVVEEVAALAQDFVKPLVPAVRMLFGAGSNISTQVE